MPEHQKAAKQRRFLKQSPANDRPANNRHSDNSDNPQPRQRRWHFSRRSRRRARIYVRHIPSPRPSGCGQKRGERILGDGARVYAIRLARAQFTVAISCYPHSYRSDTLRGWHGHRPPASALAPLAHSPTSSGWIWGGGNWSSAHQRP